MQRISIVLLNSAIIAVAFSSLGSMSRRTWPIVAIISVLSFIVNKVPLAEWINARSKFTQKTVSLWYLFLLFIGIYLVRQFLQNLVLLSEMAEVVPLTGALDLLFKGIMLLVVLGNVMIWSRQLVDAERWKILYISIGFYAAFNLLAGPVLGIESTSFGESRFEWRDKRWMPPLVRSNSFFSMICVVSLGGWIIMLVQTWRRSRESHFLNAIVSIAVLLAAYAAYLCEFRANVLIVITALGIIAASTLRLVNVLRIGLLIAVIVFPVTFFSDFGHKIIEKIAPDNILAEVGSRTDDSSTLSYRTIVWEYAGNQLLKPNIFLFGEGPVLRDAQPALGDFKADGYRMPYHSAFLDFLVPHGAILGGVGFILVVVLSSKLSQLVARNNVYSISNQALANMMLWFSTGIMDSGFSSFETLLLIALPAFGALTKDCSSAVTVPTIHPRPSRIKS